MFRKVTRAIGVLLLLNVLVQNPELLAQIKSGLSGNGVTQPVAQPAPVRGVNGEVRFTATDNGRPVVWETCEIVPVLVNPGRFGDEALELTRTAVAELRKLTGVAFTVTGTTDAIPTTRWYAEGGTGGAEGFAPVIVAFVDRDRTDMLAKGAVGSAVANPAGSGTQRRLVTGAVVLDADAIDEMRRGYSQGASWGTALSHELGHLAGLDHATSGLMAENLNSKMRPAYSAKVREAFGTLRPVC